MGNVEITNALAAWIIADKKMRIAVQEELDARAHLQTLAFPTPTEGTNNAPLPDGTILKGMFRNNYTLSGSETENMLKKLPKAVAANLIKWKPELSTSAYKALEPAHRAIVNSVLTIKPGRPSLEIVTPKER